MTLPLMVRQTSWFCLRTRSRRASKATPLFESRSSLTSRAPTPRRFRLRRAKLWTRFVVGMKSATALSSRAPRLARVRSSRTSRRGHCRGRVVRVLSSPSSLSHHSSPTTPPTTLDTRLAIVLVPVVRARASPRGRRHHSPVLGRLARDERADYHHSSRVRARAIDVELTRVVTLRRRRDEETR